MEGWRPVDLDAIDALSGLGIQGGLNVWVDGIAPWIGKCVVPNVGLERHVTCVWYHQSCGAIYFLPT